MREEGNYLELAPLDAVSLPKSFIRGVGGPSVDIPVRAAAWLVHQPEFKSLYRRSVTDPHARAALNAFVEGRDVHEYVVSWREQSRKRTQAGTDSLVMNTRQAAKAAGVTPSAIRLAINEERLPAHREGGHWFVLREHVEQYRNHRRGAIA